MMKAVLITIGDEILAGNTVDTNSHSIAGELRKIGIRVERIYTISDDVATIVETLDLAFRSADLVLTTGGLGPTRDDRTKTAFLQFFDDFLKFNEDVFSHLTDLLKRRNRLHILELNRPQAMVPSRAHIFQNDYGTAPALLMRKGERFAVCLPGVPSEVKPLVREKVIPYLVKNHDRPHVVSRTLSVVNYPESQLAEDIKSWEDALPPHISLSYLPVSNRVKLKLTAVGSDKNALEQELHATIAPLLPMLNNHLISDHADTAEEMLHDLLFNKKLTISVAESCTGGSLSRLITSVPGSSAYFRAGMVAYDEKEKIKLLGVQQATLSAHSVVSAEVAGEMARGCRDLFDTDIAISTTGVAGPGTDSYENPVGLAYMTLCIGSYEKTIKLEVPNLDRQDFMAFVAMRAIQELVFELVQMGNTNKS